MNFKFLAGAWTPALPLSRFAWDHVLERLLSVARGHALVMLWGAAVLGGGTVLARLAWVPHHGDPTGGLVLRFGCGMAIAMLAWLGLGLTGLWYPLMGWLLVILGLMALYLMSAGRSPDHGAPQPWTATGLPWLLAGISAEVLLSVFLVVAVGLAAWWSSRESAGVASLVWGWAFIALGGWIWWFARGVLRSAQVGLESRATRWIMAGLVAEAGVAVLLLVSVCSAPDRFYDAQVYHLATPALFAQYHKVIGLPNLLHASFPLGMQMLYGWQWLLGGDIVVRAWRPWLFGLVLWLIWRLGAREGRPQAGLVAACLFAVCPLLLLNAMHTSVDVEVCLLILLACWAAREAQGGIAETTPGSVSTRAAWNVRCAIFASAALAMKYTAVFWIPWLVWFSAGFHRRRLAVFAGIGVIWMLPWLIRNVAVVGNPVYPYATAVFSQGRQWDPPRQQRFLEQSATYVVEKKTDLLLLPWLLSKGNDSETFVGPALLLFAPVVLFRLRPVLMPLRVYGLIAGASVVFWVTGTHILRFLLATWGLLGLLVAWVVWELGQSKPRIRQAGLALLFVVGFANLAAQVLMWRKVFDPVEVLAGRESRLGYLNRKMLNSYTEIVDSARSGLTRNDRVLLVGETRGLYWPVAFVNHSVYDRQMFEEVVRDSVDPEEAAKRFRQRGVTHLFFNDAETSRMKFRFNYPMLEFDGRERGVIDGLWDHWVEQQASHRNRTVLYRLLDEPRAVPGGPAQPLSLHAEVLRRTFEGYTEVTWEGDVQIRATKQVRR